LAPKILLLTISDPNRRAITESIINEVVPDAATISVAEGATLWRVTIESDASAPRTFPVDGLHGEDGAGRFRTDLRRIVSLYFADR